MSGKKGNWTVAVSGTFAALTMASLNDFPARGFVIGTDFPFGEQVTQHGGEGFERTGPFDQSFSQALTVDGAENSDRIVELIDTDVPVLELLNCRAVKKSTCPSAGS